MPKTIKKTKSRSFSTTAGIDTMIAKLMETDQYTNISEVVRAALRTLHKKHFPYYKVIAEEKDKEQQAKAELMELPVDEYIDQVFPGADTDSEPGKIILRHKDNPVQVVKISLDKVKNFASRNDVWKSIGYPIEND